MKALTIRQPFAWGIIHGTKRVENRSRPTSHRGLLLIHAGSSRQDLGRYGRGEPSEGRLVFGAFIGTVEVIDCVPVEQAPAGRFTVGPWCWLLANPTPFIDPIPYRGRQSLFEVPDEFIRDPAGWLLFRSQ